MAEDTTAERMKKKYAQDFEPKYPKVKWNYHRLKDVIRTILILVVV